MFNRWRENVSKMLPDHGRVSSIPAGIIDKMALNEPQGIIDTLWEGIKNRVVYVGLFLPAVAIDFATNILSTSYYRIKSNSSSGTEKKYFSQQSQKYTNMLGDNFMAILGSPVGLYDVTLVSYYFVPEETRKNVIISGSHHHQTANVELRLPASPQELQAIIAEADKLDCKLIPVGAGYSQGKQFLPSEEKSIVVDLKKMKTIEINAEEKTAVVEAGVRWEDLQLAANKYKLAVSVMQASNVFSVGGSIGTNIHGWNHQTGMLSNTILSMDVIDAKGQISTVTPNDELFHYVTSGLGLYGVVARAKLKLTDNEELSEKNVDVPIADYIAYFNTTVLTNKQIHMHLYRLSIDPTRLFAHGIAVNYVKVDHSTSVITPQLTAETTYGTRLHNVALNLARHYDFVRKAYWQYESKSLISKKTEITTTNAAMQPPIKALFSSSVSEADWLQEFFVPECNLVAFLNYLRKLLMDNHVALLNASVRFVPENKYPIFSYAPNSDRFAIVLCFNQSLKKSKIKKAEQWIREAQAKTVSLGGTYYLPYQPITPVDDFKKAYPTANKALAFKNKIDPKQRFSSGFFKEYMLPQISVLKQDDAKKSPRV
jgi:UDP-N-acetylenolpyruvoylglucosamine reductase